MLVKQKAAASSFAKFRRGELSSSISAAFAAVSLPCALIFAPVYSPVYAQEAAKLPPMQINASRPGNQTSVAGISEADLNNTPLAVSIITSDSIRNYGFNSLSGLLRLEPSAGDAYNTLGYIESLNLRGFLLDNRFNYRRDGLPISNHMPIALENKERYEVLKGNSGLLAGVSAPGGLLNSVLKRPTSQALTEANLTISEKGTSLLAADLSRRFENFGVRINLANSHRKPFADAAPGSRQLASALVDYRIGSHRFEAEVEWQKSKQISVPGLGLLDRDGDGTAETLPSLPSARLNLNGQPWALPFESNSLISSVKWESTLVDSSTLQIRSGFRANWQTIRTNDRIAFPDGCSSGLTYVYPGLCGNYDVDIYDYRSENERRKMNSQEIWLRASFKTGTVKHDSRITLLRNRYNENFAPFQTYNYAGTINALAPTLLAAVPDALEANTNYARTSTELSISDALTFNSQWSLWLGLRRTQLNAQSIRTDGLYQTNYQQSFTTPWAALNFKPTAGSLVYLSAGQGVESEVVPNRSTRFANAGAALPALKSKQIELGAKLSLPAWNEQLATGQLNIAAYQITKPFSGDVVLGSDPLPTRLAGARQAKHQGLEVQWQQAIAPSFDVLISGAITNARQSKNIDASLVDKRITNVEPSSLTLALGWQPSAALRWQNTFSFNAGKPVTADNSVNLPSAIQWDTWLSYQIVSKSSAASRQPAIAVRFGVDNVLDKRYWRDAPTQSWGGLYLFAAQPRTLRVAVTGSF
jgi:iron complex outermembrane recepter protein